MPTPLPPEAVDETSDLDLTTPPAPAWRRPLLLAGGISLLAFGVYVNAERLGFEADDERFADEKLYAQSYEEEEPPPEEEEPPPEDERLPQDTSQRHKGEEGKMGKPSSKAKSGLYAVRGPVDALPQMARSFEPNMAARSAGILGVMQQQSGHFLASPHGGAMAVGNDDAEVWGGLTGTAVGESYGVAGLGLVGVGKGGGGIGGGQMLRDPGGERYAQVPPNVFIPTAKDAKSTFSIDVDTAAYANTRRFLLDHNQLPPPESVRTEELINYFDYDYALPSGEHAPFSVTTEVGPSPWNAGKRLVHIGVQGMVVDPGETPARNLVFLIDVSGSMQSSDKLPLVKFGLASLVEQLDAKDRVSIVVYAGAAGAVLEPTAGDDHQAILDALDRLRSGGGTNGGQGIVLAYRLAQRAFIRGGVNRVILASDGDFNVGLRDHDALVRLIETKRRSGVYLSVLGVGTGNYNDHMMEQLADKGNGNYAYLDSMTEARKVLVEESGAMLQTIAKDVKIQVEFDPKQVVKHRLVGYENRVLAHRDFDDDTKDAGEIGAGHTVTALYEIVPTRIGDGHDLMTLSLRYKQPDAARSHKISTVVDDLGQDLAGSSRSYRWSAAVAAFAEHLRGTQSEMSYAEILELARRAIGADPHCYRHQFLDMVWRAGVLAGEDIDRPDVACVPGDARRRKPVVDPQREPKLEPDLAPPPADDPRPEPELEPELEPEVRGDDVQIHVVHVHEPQPEWMSFMLEVLRLLPPLLALPLFVLAYRKPRRRR